MTSRVVPAISEVMAASRPAIRLRSVDLPTFGGPTIATSNPSRTRSAIRTPSYSRCMPARTRVISASTSGRVSTGTSSSAKSIVASSSAAARIRSRRQPSATSPNAPDNTRSACLRWPSVSASIKSASPSTWARSSWPFSSARRVNSPASAARKSGWSPNTRRTAATTAGLP